MSRPFSCVMALVFLGAASAADLQFDGLVDDAGRQLLIGKPTVIQFINGTVVDDVAVLGFIKGPRSDAIRFFQYQDGNRKPRKKTTDVYRLLIDGKPYSFRYHRPSGGVHLIDLDKAQADAEARIAGSNRTLRSPQTDDEIKAAVSEQIEVFNDARKALAPVHLSYAESDFCLLLTDFPQQAAEQVARQVDVMCQQMNGVFGLPKNANIWNGKIIVAVFSHRELFGKFEVEVMDNPNFGTSTTIYHHNRHRFLVATHRTKLDAAVASTISWSMADGYVRRYRSDVNLPRWVQSGLQDTLHRVMFPNPKRDAAARKRAADWLRRTRSLVGILQATELDDDREVLAKLLVIHLLEADPTAFSQFFEDLKLGHEWDDALMANYGVTPEAFVGDFGRKMGVPNLIP
ncbi:MAG: hypothetical protein ACF788_03165 [Novipirellula sp. JB048]